MGLSLVPHCSMSLWQLQGITVCGLQEAPPRSEATKEPNLQERLMDKKKKKPVSGSCKIQSPEGTERVTGSGGVEGWGGASVRVDDVDEHPCALTPSAP